MDYTMITLPEVEEKFEKLCTILDQADFGEAPDEFYKELEDLVAEGVLSTDPIGHYCIINLQVQHIQSLPQLKNGVALYFTSEEYAEKYATVFLAGHKQLHVISVVAAIS